MKRFEEEVFVAIRKDAASGEEIVDPSTVSYSAEGAKAKARSASNETNARQPVERIASAILASRHGGH